MRLAKKEKTFMLWVIEHVQITQKLYLKYWSSGIGRAKKIVSFYLSAFYAKWLEVFCVSLTGNSLEFFCDCNLNGKD